MGKFSAIDEIKRKYEHHPLMMNVSWDRNRKVREDQEESYRIIAEALELVGVNLEIENNDLCISINPYKYAEVTKHTAGRRTIKLVKERDENHMPTEYYTYAHIISMLETMTDKEIMEQIGMKSATYYRHKKVMRAKTDGIRLDKNRLYDIDYLRETLGKRNIYF